MSSNNDLNSKKINNNKKPISNFWTKIPLDYYFSAFVASFCLASFLTVLNIEKAFTNLQSVLSISLGLFIVYLVGFFVAILFITWAFNRLRLIPIALAISSILFASALSYYNSNNIYFNIALTFILFLVFAWICKDDKMQISNIKFFKNSEWVIAIILAIIFVIAVSVVTIARYDAYMAHNYDLGIFAQMFKNMSITGLAETTVERNVLMNHFGVHFSPFYYLLLPFYMIAPHTETLLVIQALAIASGVFPLILICKKLELSSFLTVGFSFIYILFPTLSNATLFDFHENKFLTVLILWVLYFMVAKKTIPFFIFVMLTLSVKEDAAIYIITIALFMMIYRKEIKKGSILLGLSIAYFVFATAMVHHFNVLNEGIMISRLGNYIPTEGGFLEVAITCFTNIGYMITQVFTPEKVGFMLWMFLPLAFTPFMNKKKSVLILLIPMLVINLMSEWKYQFDVKYQYTYGVVALIIFMALLGVKYLSKEKQVLVTTLSIAICMVFCSSLFIAGSTNYVASANQNKDLYKSYDELISTIPKDSRIVANGFYTAHMYDFTNLYQYASYGENIEDLDSIEYYLVPASDYSSNTGSIATIIGDKYQLVDSANNMQLYKKK